MLYTDDNIISPTSCGEDLKKKELDNEIRTILIRIQSSNIKRNCVVLKLKSIIKMITLYATDDHHVMLQIQRA